MLDRQRATAKRGNSAVASLATDSRCWYIASAEAVSLLSRLRRKICMIVRARAEPKVRKPLKF
jgi:hypothetical protein